VFRQQLCDVACKVIALDQECAFASTGFVEAGLVQHQAVILLDNGAYGFQPCQDALGCLRPLEVERIAF
jgi:hypothetical protein